MKKRVLLIAGCLSFALCASACGGESSAPVEPTTAVPTVESTAAPETELETEAETEADLSAPFIFETDDYSVEYVKHEVGKDYEGNPCVLVYYNFTNKGEEATSAMIKTYIQAFQNGIECDTAIVMDENEAVSNYQKDIQKGITLEVCHAFSIKDMSDVKLEVSEVISFDNKKSEQIIKLQ